MSRINPVYACLLLIACFILFVGVMAQDALSLFAGAYVFVLSLFGLVGDYRDA